MFAVTYLSYVCAFAHWPLYLYEFTVRSVQGRVDQRPKQPGDSEGLCRQPKDLEGLPRHPEAQEDPRRPQRLARFTPICD